MSHVLRNAAGMTVRFLGLGGIITHIEVPDCDGRFANVVVNLPDEASYRRLNRTYYLGALIGRYAGRIAGARYDGHVLPANNGPNTLHGGDGFDMRDWQVEQLDEATARLGLISPDGDQGFPGWLKVAVTYALLPDNVLRIAYEATADAPTVVNLTQHSYFNLGEEEEDLSGHLLQIFASRRAAIDRMGIPTGDFPEVAGTPFDFREPRPIEADFDNSWLLDRPAGLAARLSHPASGRVLEVETSEPTCHMYNAIHFPADGPLRPRSAVALETQHLPDSPNRPDFPSARLLPGETFRSETRWRFLVV